MLYNAIPYTVNIG